MSRSTRGRRPDPRRAKTHFSYTVAEAARLYGVHRNTVRNWTRNGLETIRAGGSILILGGELRAYHGRKRAERRVKCPPGSMYCLKCRDARRPPDDLIESIPVTPTCVNLRGICPACGSLMHRRANLVRMGEIGFGHVAPQAGACAPRR